MSETGQLFPPATHSGDAWTSHAAEREHTKSGARKKHCEVVYGLVFRFPSRTASELEEHAPYDLQEVRRRLTDLKHADRVFQCGTRKRKNRLKTETTWSVKITS